MAQCTTKGCPYSALIGKEKCRQHLSPPEIPKPVEAAEYEIVTMDAVPKFRIHNEKTYALAKAIGVLKEGHAIKARIPGKQQPTIQSVSSYCRKLSIKMKYRTSPGLVYFWRA
jgi:hypothetical protein